jgi:hypothetical protein
MSRRYKIIPVVALAFYALCAVCPERARPALGLQTAAASDAHDCHDSGKQKPEANCRAAFSEFLPTSEVKFAHVVTVHALLLPLHVLSAAFDFLPGFRTTHFSTAGPSIPSLKINLRI